MKTKTNRSDALIRDIAKLFVQYPPAVWRPIVDDLVNGSETHVRIAEQIDKLSTLALEKTRRPARASRKEPIQGQLSAKDDDKPVPVPSSPFAHRQDLMEELWDAIAERRLLPTAAHLRDAYMASGGKDELPKSRRSAMVPLFQHLDRLTNEQFDHVLQKMKERTSRSDTDEQYKRWFNIIKKSH